MMIAVITIGVSGSGKTTWANAQEGYLVIEKDKIRADLQREFGDHSEFNWKKWKKKNEPTVHSIFLKQINEAAERKQNIILSNTNLDNKKNEALCRMLEELGYQVEYKTFEIDYLEAIARDAGRPNSVGHLVIGQQFAMLNKMNKQNWPPTQGTRGSCILVDIDGTIANNEDRNPYDMTLVKNDKPIQEVIDLVKALCLFDLELKVVFITARPANAREDTTAWLKRHGLWNSTLLMRNEGDLRKDSVIKKELYEQYIEGNYTVKLVIDDRPSVCRMWRSLGLMTLQCGDPHNEF